MVLIFFESFKYSCAIFDDLNQYSWPNSAYFCHIFSLQSANYIKKLPHKSVIPIFAVSIKNYDCQVH